MNFTDAEIKDFKNIAVNYTSVMIHLEQELETLKQADPFDGLAEALERCDKQIIRMERFEAWLGQNDDKVM